MVVAAKGVYFGNAVTNLRGAMAERERETKQSRNFANGQRRRRLLYSAHSVSRARQPAKRWSAAAAGSVPFKRRILIALRGGVCVCNLLGFSA